MLGVDRGALLRMQPEELEEEAYARYWALVERRSKGEPTAYLLGSREFMSLDFAVNEAVLYLDTHTDDQAALAYYDKYRTLLREAVRKYEDSYGPLTMYEADAGRSWTWVADPWPWEYDAQ